MRYVQSYSHHVGLGLRNKLTRKENTKHRKDYVSENVCMVASWNYSVLAEFCSHSMGVIMLMLSAANLSTRIFPMC